MTSMFRPLAALCVLSLLIAAGACQKEGRCLENLAEGQTLHGFRLLNLYEDGAGRVMGGRLVSESHGFLVDLLRIQSVPQGFMWIKTVPWSDRGEPHACEHLLLGKGTQGRYVAALEEMTLGSSSAWTSQLNTVYHFNTLAGEGGFYQTLAARLKALVNPDFTDEEIRREVSHIGVAEDPATGALFLEEKGTVFTEMVSSFEGPGYPLWGTVGDLLYGKDHPAANSSGGHPDSMRTMRAEDLWEFHREHYRPAKMGIIASLPDEMSLGEFLERLGGILEGVCPEGDASGELGMNALTLPPPAPPEPSGALRVLPYASENPQDPGRVLLSWPAQNELDAEGLFLLRIFLESFAGGAGTPLYDAFIGSETRRMDLGARSVWGYLDEGPGFPIQFGLNGVRAERIDKATLAELRALLVEEIRGIHALADGSAALREFNERATSRLSSYRKQLVQALDQPPMFGYRRGAAGYWQRLLRQVEREEGFRKSLVLAERFAAAESLLAEKENIWRGLIDEWRLLDADPHVVGVRPSPELLREARASKVERLARFLAHCRNHYQTVDEQEAIARYKADFDATTAELEALAAEDQLPRFIDDPPLTLDDQLDYEMLTLPAGPPLMAATFDNMSSATLGIALGLDVLPADLLPTLPLLRRALVEAGATIGGELVGYVEMQERLRREVTSYSAYFDLEPEHGRAELVLRGSAGDEEEMAALLSWMEASLWSPYLEEDNLPRLRDIVDQALTRLRSRMQGSEESWVNDPAEAYRYQDDPLYLSAGSFLTQTHHLHRLKWLLREQPVVDDGEALRRFLDQLSAEGAGQGRDGLMALLDAAPAKPTGEEAAALADEIVSSLRRSLSDLPDASLSADWSYLLGEIARDLAMPPAVTLARLRASLDLLQGADNARLFLVSSGGAREAALPGISQLAERLGKEPSRRIDHRGDARILARLRERGGPAERPLFVGLVNDNTRNGTVIFSARNADTWDDDPEKVLDALAGKLYGGGGGHGLFMRTWAAGLAYSNGYSYSDVSGFTRYYAERCPDVAQTMRFVTGILESAEVDDELVEYAVALAFGRSRAAGRYESRGEAMAADLVDGVGPEVVRAYREQVLALRERKDLAAELKARMEGVYGQVLAGYGQPLSASRDGVFFLIGPEEQFASMEDYIAAVEQPRSVQRLYPRDFWLVD